MSAPKSIGRCKTGVAKQLSTANKILASLQISPTISKSIISKAGLEGVSKYKIFVFD